RSRFDGCKAVVTGSGRGIGYEVAKMLLFEGASVVINDVDSARLTHAEETLEINDGRLRAALADVPNPDAGESLMNAAVDAFGGVNVLINVVGGSYGAPHMRLMDFNLDDWFHLLDLNLTSVFLCAKSAIPHLRGAGGGAI